jgi:hypothetical protein
VTRGRALLIALTTIALLLVGASAAGAQQVDPAAPVDTVAPPTTDPAGPTVAVDPIDPIDEPSINTTQTDDEGQPDHLVARRHQQRRLPHRGRHAPVGRPRPVDVVHHVPPGS